MPDTAEHALAKQAAELWHDDAMDYITQIVAAAERLMQHARPYADQGSVADDVHSLLDAGRDIIHGAAKAATAAQRIGAIHYKEVIEDATPALGMPEGERS